MSTPTTPAELIAQAAARHQAAQDATAQVSAEIADRRAKEAAAQAQARVAQESGR